MSLTIAGMQGVNQLGGPAVQESELAYCARQMDENLGYLEARVSVLRDKLEPVISKKESTTRAAGPDAPVRNMSSPLTVGLSDTNSRLVNLAARINYIIDELAV